MKKIDTNYTKNNSKIQHLNSKRPFKRILLKLSGEILSGNSLHTIDVCVVRSFAKQIAEIYNLGIEIAIVVGGGNILRGTQAASEGLDRVSADYMGMMATIINGLALQNILEEIGLITRLQTAIEIKSIAEPFIRRKAIRHLEKKRVVILSGGTGNPYFTTDTTAALRAVELGANSIFKATKVDGVYDADPNISKDAKRFSYISFMEAIQRKLKIMDSTAFTLCMDNSMPILVFHLEKEGEFRRAVEGNKVGTLIGKKDGVTYYE